MSASPSDAPIIHMRQIRRIFRMGDEEVHAVAGVDLTVQRGEWVAVMGASGSGKSTLMNLLGCLDTPTAGAYSLRGHPIEGRTDDQLAELRNREIGFVFQSFNLLPRLSARDNVELPLSYARVDPRERRKLSDAMLDRVGLANRKGHRPNQLSGGQRQRVAIARALVHSPALVLADEPTGNLDSETSAEILDLFDDLHTQGNTLVMVTHEQEIADRARRVVRMRDGKIVEDVRRAA